MHISLILAKTYLLSFKQRAFISFINVLSFIGLIIGVASLICVTSIFNGFRELVRDMLLTIDPHIRITLTDTFSENATSALKNAYRDIATISNSASSKIVISYQDKTQAGILLTKESDSIDHSSSNHVSIGIGLADKLGVKKGDTIRVSTPDMLDIAISGFMIPKNYTMIIDSIFQISSGVQYDNAYILCNYDYHRDQAIVGKQYLDLKLHSIDNLELVINKLRSEPMLKEMKIESWKDLHQELYSTMEFERNMSFIILGIITCVSAFNILIAMWMTVKSKGKDIATLLSMGARTKDIQLTFILQGLIIGIAGTISGAALGILLCLGQQRYGWIELPNSIVQAMPVSLQWEVVVISSLLGIIVAGLAGMYPARLATHITISNELRHE
ncbi:MAG: FtsX-like permease family protein [Ignavibacteria bacterium]